MFSEKRFLLNGLSNLVRLREEETDALVRTLNQLDHQYSFSFITVFIARNVHWHTDEYKMAAMLEALTFLQ